MLPAIIRQFPQDEDFTERLVLSLWPNVVGKTVAQKTEPTRLHRSSLIVSVPDETWKRELFALRFEILAKLEKLVGSHRVASLDLRVDRRMNLTQAFCKGVTDEVPTESKQLSTLDSPQLELEQGLAAAAASYFKPKAGA